MSDIWPDEEKFKEEYSNYRRICQELGVTDEITEYDATLLMAKRIVELENKLERLNEKDNT